MRNNNQRVIRRLCAGSLRQSRVRNRIAVAAIVLTSLLFSGIFTFVSGMAQITEEETMREVGTRTHAGLKAVTKEQLERITASPEIRSFSWNIFLGIAANVTDRQTELRCASGEDELENSFITLEEGRVPQERLDLAADAIVLECLGIEPELGAQVPLEFDFQGERRSETFTLCGWYTGDYVSHASELYLSETYWEELRGGRTEADLAAWGKTHPADRGVGLYNVNIWFDSARGIEKHIRGVIEDAGYVPETEVDYGVNWAYMSSRLENLDGFQLAGGAAALLTVILTGYLIIHNIFQISILGDIRFYGLLKTIGATGKQIRKLVRRQAWILSAVGIPLGLCLGAAGCRSLFPLAISFLDLRGMRVKLSLNPWIFLFGGIFSLFTVFLSCRKPERIAAKVSPVEAVRYTEAGGGKRKRKNSYSGGRIPKMALANLGRSKGKTCAVVLSMTFSIVLLSFVLTAMNSFRLDSYIEVRMTGDFLLANSNLTGSRLTPDDSLDEAYIAGADEQEGITGRSEIWDVYGARHFLKGEALRLFSRFDEQGLVMFDEDVGDITRETIRRIRDGGWGIQLNESAYTPELLERIPVLEGKFDPEKFQTGDYVLVGTFFGNIDTGAPLYHPGDRLTLRFVKEDSRWNGVTDDDGNLLYYDYENTEDKDYEVMAVIDLPQSMRTILQPNSFDVVLPLSEAKRQSGSDMRLLSVGYDVEPEYREAFENYLKEYTENINPQMGYLSADVLRREFSGMVRSVGLLGVVLSAVIALVGILNFLNAILTGIQARRREFAMLQSIGMTGKQLSGLLVCEGLCYAGMAGVLGIAAGSLAGYFAVRGLEQMIVCFRYRFTALPYLILLPVFLAAAVALPALALKRMERESIVERLREAEE